MDNSSRVALVTGGTSGIGAAISEATLAAGYRVAANYGHNAVGARGVVFLTADDANFINGITLSNHGGKYLA